MSSQSQTPFIPFRLVTVLAEMSRHETLTNRQDVLLLPRLDSGAWLHRTLPGRGFVRGAQFYQGIAIRGKVGHSAPREAHKAQCARHVVCGSATATQRGPCVRRLVQARGRLLQGSSPHHWEKGWDLSRHFFRHPQSAHTRLQSFVGA